ncbi:MAG: helix-turn-helix transcriptional regulator [Streptomycetales bacterium]
MTRPRHHEELAADDEKLTVDDIVADLKISRRTFYQWRQTGKGPRCHVLPNRELRVRKADYLEWLASLLKDAAA